MSTFIDWARQNNWQIELAEDIMELPFKAFQRYSSLPAEYTKFLQSLTLFSNEEDTSWFLMIDDFSSLPFDTPWQPDSFEIISLEAAQGDSNLKNEIIQFWDNHIPIVFSLKNGYEYYAICLEDGTVVHGTEPEFEETSVVANSFTDFLEKIIAGDIIL